MCTDFHLVEVIGDLGKGNLVKKMLIWSYSPPHLESFSVSDTV